MKNPIKNQNSTIGSIIFPLLIILVSFFQSCDTEIPPTDTEPPSFSFKITGDGFDHTFTQDDDFNSFQLNLREDALYDFIYTSGDAGGLKLMQMQFPFDYLEFESVLNSTWTQANSGLSTVLTWSGDAASPITGNILTGNFRVNGDLIAFGVFFDMRDYGGQSGSSNTLFKDLNILSANHTTEIITF